MRLFFILKAILSTGKNIWIFLSWSPTIFLTPAFDREARRIYQEAKAVFAKWSRKPGCYGCKVCSRADSAESPMLLCDHCCQGIHQNCFLLPGSRVLSLLTQVCGLIMQTTSFSMLIFTPSFAKWFGWLVACSWRMSIIRCVATPPSSAVKIAIVVS